MFRLRMSTSRSICGMFACRGNGTLTISTSRGIRNARNVPDVFKEDGRIHCLNDIGKVGKSAALMHTQHLADFNECRKKAFRKGGYSFPTSNRCRTRADAITATHGSPLKPAGFGNGMMMNASASLNKTRLMLTLTCIKI